jgi:hypothetical protein
MSELDRDALKQEMIFWRRDLHAHPESASRRSVQPPSSPPSCVSSASMMSPRALAAPASSAR